MANRDFQDAEPLDKETAEEIMRLAEGNELLRFFAEQKPELRINISNKSAHLVFPDNGLRFYFYGDTATEIPLEGSKEGSILTVLPFDGWEACVAPDGSNREERMIPLDEDV